MERDDGESCGLGLFRFEDVDADFQRGGPFAAGGNQDPTAWALTQCGTVSFLAKDHIVNHESHWTNYRAPEDARGVLDATAKEDLIIVAASEPADSRAPRKSPAPPKRWRGWMRGRARPASRARCS